MSELCNSPFFILHSIISLHSQLEASLIVFHFLETSVSLLDVHHCCSAMHFHLSFHQSFPVTDLLGCGHLSCSLKNMISISTHLNESHKDVPFTFNVVLNWFVSQCSSPLKSTMVCLQTFSPSGLMFSNMTRIYSSKNDVSAGITKRTALGEEATPNLVCPPQWPVFHSPHPCSDTLHSLVKWNFSTQDDTVG